MNKRNRNLLLALARRLDRWAMQLRKLVRAQTPKRVRKAEALEVKT